MPDAEFCDEIVGAQPVELRGAAVDRRRRRRRRLLGPRIAARRRRGGGKGGRLGAADSRACTAATRCCKRAALCAMKSWSVAWTASADPVGQSCSSEASACCCRASWRCHGAIAASASGGRLRRRRSTVRAHPVEGVAVDAGGGGGQRAQRLLAALLAPLVAVPHLGDDAPRPSADG